jgi:hypothetical protein
MMLWIAPETVDMERALKDCAEKGKGGLTRDPDGEGTYSPTGILGRSDARDAGKGREAVRGALEDRAR